MMGSVKRNNRMINISDLQCFKEGAYSRNLVLKSDNVEILVVCWQPGQGTVVHGHDTSDGLMMILSGEMTEIQYLPNGGKEERQIGPGDISHVPVGYRHEVKNTSNRNVVSFHVYAPPLKKDIQSLDLGYDNDVSVEEVQLPQSAVKFIMGQAAKIQQQQAEDAGYHYEI